VPVAEDLLVAEVERFVGDLAAAADRVEREGVERVTLDRLAAAGLYGIQGPEWAGGRDVAGATYRRIAELLAGADANTWLVWFQHHPVVRMLAGCENVELQKRLLPSLCSGQVRAGVAFSHLRSATPTITARATDGGWRLTGRQPWCTGWGLIDVVLVGAVTDDDQVMLALVPTDRGGLRPSGELSLSAMNGTHTVALELHDLTVTPADVVVLVPRSEWTLGDAMRASNVQPSAVGIALAALDVLHLRAPEQAAQLGSRLADLRARAYELCDETPTIVDVPERLQLAARLLLITVEITSTLVVSLGGSALATSQPAQRWAREATFHLVFAQTADLREAVLTATATRT